MEQSSVESTSSLERSSSWEITDIRQENGGFVGVLQHGKTGRKRSVRARHSERIQQYVEALSRSTDMIRPISDIEGGCSTAMRTVWRYVTGWCVRMVLFFVIDVVSEEVL